MGTSELNADGRTDGLLCNRLASHPGVGGGGVGGVLGVGVGGWGGGGGVWGCWGWGGWGGVEIHLHVHVVASCY